MTAFLLIAVLLVLAAGGAFAVALARRGKADYEAQGEIVPGLASEAPAEWAGAHTPEAKLHRRLGQAVRSLRTVSGQPGESVRLLELRVELEQQALEVDRRLIAAAGLPAGAKEPAVAKAQEAVVAIEQAAADLALQISGGDVADRALADLTDRIALAGQVRAELDELEGLATPEMPPEIDDEPGGTTATG